MGSDRMNGCAKKVIADADVEGSDESWQIKCDMVSEGDAAFAVLQWGPRVKLAGARVARLDTSVLFPSSREGVDFEYVGRMVPVPRDLAEMDPKPLTEEGFRLGFLRVA